MKKYLRTINNFFSLRLFSNTLGPKNILFFLYWKFAVLLYSFKSSFKKDVNLKKNFSKNGFALIHKLNVENLSKKVNELFLKEENYENISDGYFFLKPKIASLLDKEIINVIFEIENKILSIYGCNFKIYFSNIQRSIPVKNNIEKYSDLYHFDDNPVGTSKIFIYLSDQYKDTGAFRAFDKKNSKFLKKKGFLSYTTEIRQKCQKLAESMSKDSLKVQEGEKGTVMCFDVNLIHKGTLPQKGNRDLIVFEVFPSFEKINDANIKKSLIHTFDKPDYPNTPFFK